MLRTSLILLSICLSGCTMIYTRMDKPLPLDELHMAAGTTHFHEVLDALGPPSRVSALPDGFGFIYESLMVREMQVGLSGSSFSETINLLKLTVADANLQHQVFLLHFDTDGLLISASKLDSKSDLGMGGSIQMLVSVSPVVDASAFVDDATAPFDWGLLLCDPLPVALNSRQSLRSGMAGLEQAGTGTKTGQHALEMR